MDGKQLRRLFEAALLTIMVIAAAAANVSADRAAPAAAPTGDRAGGPAPKTISLAMRMVNAADAPADALESAMREAEAIWATAGIRLIWTDAVDEAPAGQRGDVVFVVVRAEIAPTRWETAAATLSRRAARSQAMGRVLFEGTRRANLLEVSLNNVVASIAREPLFKRDVTPLDEPPRYQVLGRALGRVIAHEIGHWLHGTGHTPGGLMSPSLSSRQLVTVRAPALPKAWLAKPSREATP